MQISITHVESSLFLLRRVVEVPVVVVSCGTYHTVFVRGDGSLWGAGRNKEGQLGLGHGAPTNVRSFTTVPGITPNALGVVRTRPSDPARSCSCWTIAVSVKSVSEDVPNRTLEAVIAADMPFVT